MRPDRGKQNLPAKRTLGTWKPTRPENQESHKRKRRRRGRRSRKARPNGQDEVASKQPVEERNEELNSKANDGLTQAMGSASLGPDETAAYSNYEKSSERDDLAEWDSTHSCGTEKAARARAGETEGEKGIFW